MFSVKLTNKLLLTTTLVAMLSSCGLFHSDKKYSSATNWVLGISDEEKSIENAEKATVAYSQGNFDEAEKCFSKALNENPKNQQALMVAALTSEKQGKLNKARAYYEDIIINGGDDTTILGTENGLPQKMTEVAQKRLNNIALYQSKIIMEDQAGNKSFIISQNASTAQGQTTMEEALFVMSERNQLQNDANTQANVKAVEILFSDEEKNIISRFLVLNDLAQKDMITKEEFLKARAENIGGLLPLTSKSPAKGIGEPVPSSDIIIGRIDALKQAVDDRAVSPKEFLAERDMIIDAILPTNPRERAKNKAPARDIMGAAKELRKLEVMSELGLITPKEKAAEKAAIERNIKTSSATKSSSVKKAQPSAKPLVSVPQTDSKSVTEKAATNTDTYKKEDTKTSPAYVEKRVEIKGTMREFPGDPNVSSPFDN